MSTLTFFFLRVVAGSFGEWLCDGFYKAVHEHIRRFRYQKALQKTERYSA